jgi:hypothetical protein
MIVIYHLISVYTRQRAFVSMQEFCQYVEKMVSVNGCDMSNLDSRFLAKHCGLLTYNHARIYHPFVVTRMLQSISYYGS